MAGNKAKEDRNQHQLPYYFILLPSYWQQALLLKTTPGKIRSNSNLCVFFSLSDSPIQLLSSHRLEDR